MADLKHIPTINIKPPLFKAGTVFLMLVFSTTLCVVHLVHLLRRLKSVVCTSKKLCSSLHPGKYHSLEGNTLSQY